MTSAEYLALPPEEQKKYQSKRTCWECDGHLVGLNGHSAGDLHVICPTCNVCPDCEDGE